MQPVVTNGAPPETRSGSTVFMTWRWLPDEDATLEPSGLWFAACLLALPAFSLMRWGY